MIRRPRPPASVLRHTLVLWALAFAAVAQPPAIGLSIDEPRAYGHVVGDRIERALRLRLPDGYRLERSSLPVAGEQSYWLELVAAEVQAEPATGGVVVVVLDYQLFYAPLQTSRRALPALEIAAVNAAGERLVTPVPAFGFTMSPILELDPDAEFGNPDNDLLLADERPSSQAVNGPRRMTLGALGIALLAGLSWAWTAGWLPGPARGPFARAATRLRQLRRRPAMSDTTATALRTVHRAFDETAHRAVFADDLDAFIAAHPSFADLADDIASFFDFSRRYFFSASACVDRDSQAMVARLERLVRRCRRRERGT
ncbi:nonribosomal peptide synthetase MxaA [Salinisphaera sp. T31B1]|uniref:nonribosomal peptide synthetase MxaA n=1 Tax=Salinisphaera sp. T31B1 TaxID=727963 RepID=UPI003342C8F1